MNCNAFVGLKFTLWLWAERSGAFRLSRDSVCSTLVELSCKMSNAVISRFSIWYHAVEGAGQSLSLARGLEAGRKYSKDNKLDLFCTRLVESFRSKFYTLPSLLAETWKPYGRIDISAR